MSNYNSGYLWSELSSFHPKCDEYSREKGAYCSFSVAPIPEDEICKASKHFSSGVDEPWSILFEQPKDVSCYGIEKLIRIPDEDLGLDCDETINNELPMVDTDPEGYLSHLRPSDVTGKIIACSSCTRFCSVTNCFLSAQNIDLDSDIFICDVSCNYKNLIKEVSKVVKDLRSLFDSRNSTIVRKKSFILISSLMTWAETNINQKTMWNEWLYPFRKPSHAYKDLFALENNLINLGKKFPEFIRVAIVGVGLIYGPSETSLNSTISRFLENSIDIPIFGTGDNLIPLIHRSDLMSFLRSLLHNFPEDYKYIFVSEKPVTQISIIDAFMSQMGRCKCTITEVNSKYGPLFSYNDAEINLLSSSLNIECFFRTKLSWRPVYSFKCYLPSLIERHISLIRKKPLCLILLGDDNDQLTEVGEMLSNHLNIPFIDRSAAVNLYFRRMQCKKKDAETRFSSDLPSEFQKSKGSGTLSISPKTGERFLNEFTGLPRGENLVQLLNILFLEPELRIKGYILKGFPKSSFEAKAMLRVLEHQEYKYSKNIIDPEDFYTSLIPSDIIVLCSSDDNKGMKYTAESVKKKVLSDIFRYKLGAPDSMLECFEDIGVYPRLFDPSEFSNLAELSMAIASSILPLYGKPKVKNGISECTSTSNATFNVLSEENGGEKFECFKGELLGNNLLIEIGNFWNDKDHMVRKYKFYKVNPCGSDEICEGIPANSNKEKVLQNNVRLKGPTLPSEYDNVVIYDARSRIILGQADGYISQHYLRNLIPAEVLIKNVCSNTQKVSLNSGKSSISFMMQQLNKSAIKRNIPYPVLKWIQDGPHVLKGSIIYWIKPVIQSEKKVMFIEEKPEEEEKPPRKISREKITYKPNYCTEHRRLRTIAEERRIENFGTIRDVIIDEKDFEYKPAVLSAKEKKFINIFSQRPSDIVKAYKLISRKDYFGDSPDVLIFLDKMNGYKPYFLRRSSVLPYLEHLNKTSNSHLIDLAHRVVIEVNDDDKTESLHNIYSTQEESPHSDSILFKEREIYHFDKTGIQFFSQFNVKDQVEEESPDHSLNSNLETLSQISRFSPDSSVSSFDYKSILKKHQSPKSKSHTRRVKFTEDMSLVDRYSSWLNVPFKDSSGDWVTLQGLKTNENEQIFDCLKNLYLRVIALKVEVDTYEQLVDTIFSSESEGGTDLNDYIIFKNLTESKWCYFREQPPELPIIPTMIMLNIERQYLAHLKKHNLKSGLPFPGASHPINSSILENCLKEIIDQINKSDMELSTAQEKSKKSLKGEDCDIALGGIEHEESNPSILKYCDLISPTEESVVVADWQTI